MVQVHVGHLARTPYPETVKAYRRLNDWMGRLSTWRYALTCGTFTFVLAVIASGAGSLWGKGRLDLAIILGTAFGCTAGVTLIATFDRKLRREQRKLRAPDARPPAEP